MPAGAHDDDHVDHIDQGAEWKAGCQVQGEGGRDRGA